MTLRDAAPSVLDLFSGIGGFSLAFERHGFRTVAFSELEPFCVRVLAHHWPDVPNLGDVRGIDGADVVRRFGAVDVLVGGFPCQDISAAGKGAGIEGARSGLWFEMLRLVRDVRPAWLLVENVPALRTRGADAVLSGLEEANYTCWPIVVGAWAVGAPHRRDRVWIVAHAQGIGRTPEGGGWIGSEQGLNAPGARLADAGRQRVRLQQGWSGGSSGADTSFAGGCGQTVADADSARCGRQRSSGLLDSKRTTHGNDTDRRHRWPARWGEPQHDWEPPRTTQPHLGRDADGLSARMDRRAGRLRRDRLRAIGNSIVPQVAELIAAWIAAEITARGEVSSDAA